MSICKLRPHHLICNLCFRGKGYTEDFVRNFTAISTELNKNPDCAMIQIVSGYDDICAQCPAKQDHLCHQENKVAEIDDAYLEILKLEVGQTIAMNALKDKIYELLSIDDFHKICAQCSWYSLDICVPIIRDLVRRAD